MGPIQGCKHSSFFGFAGEGLFRNLILAHHLSTSEQLRQIQAAGRFGVNILGHAQDEVATAFARRGTDRFAGVDWFADHGLPRLAGAVG